MFYRFGSLMVVAVLSFSQISSAATEQCLPAMSRTTKANAEQLRISAERVKVNPNRISVLQGQVQLEQAQT